MKIATWNVERLKHRRSLQEIISICNNICADILVLTETDDRIKLNYNYCFQTPTPIDMKKLNGAEIPYYKPTEHRVSIFTDHKCIAHHTTFDKYTALCVELETERGNLLVYGTIIGVFGNREKSFIQDLSKQVCDFKYLSDNGNNICICGDFNCSFSDNYYYTKDGRNLILNSFADNNIDILTSNRKECIDHIAISKRFVSDCIIDIDEWNEEKSLSDHKGIIANLIW